jgi:hypothetical protein
MRFADGCGASEWTWCTNHAVYNPHNPAPTKAPTRFIAPQAAAPVAPSVCPLPPVSPQCYLWSNNLSYGVHLSGSTQIEVVTSAGQEFSYQAVSGQTYREVAHLEFDRKNFKLRFRNKCGVSEYKACKNYTPIALDIDHSGSVERIMGTFHIDINGDGEINELQEWFAPSEGILINTNHTIVDGLISGHHMFGDQDNMFTDGFHKLGKHDDNGDQYLSGDELKGLAIWTDANSNARYDEGELSSLEDHRIVALSTQHEGFVSKAILSDGSTMVMEDLWFVR